MIITFRDRSVAVVLPSGHAVIDDVEGAHDQAVVRGMCVYAIEIATGCRPGPYSDEDAEQHAQQLLRRPRPA